jgi:alkyldihydroxyacetonephosphate synthase
VETRLRRELEAIVGSKRLSTTEPDLETYSKDMWPRLLFAERAGERPRHRPTIVVWPETTREVVAIVRVARQLRVPIVPYGGGSGVCGGAVPIHGGITIDTKRIAQLRAVQPEELIVDVDGGLSGERFERELARRGYTFGHFPSSIYCSTVGGWLATRAAGQLSTKYGKVEDRVAGLTVVTGRGELIETDGPSRALRGPNWTQLLIGSEGTLGIITSARLRVSPAPQIRIYRGYEFPDAATGLAAIRRVMHRGLRPAVVRLYDELDTFINAVGHAGASADQAAAATGPEPLAGAPRPAMSAPVPVPGQGALPAWPRPPSADDDGPLGRLLALARAPGKRLRGGAIGAALGHARWVGRGLDLVSDKVARRGCRCVIGLEGSRIRTEIEAALTFAELDSAGGRDLGEQPGWDWLAHRYAVSYRMSGVFRDGAFVDTMEVATTWDRLLELYREVRAAIGQHAVVMAHFSHAYAEGCSIYFTFAGWGDGARASEKVYDAIWRDGLEAASRVGATISHHHGVGLLKAPHMVSEHREAMAILRALKQAMDPDGIMNPGKLGLRPTGPFASDHDAADGVGS